MAHKPKANPLAMDPDVQVPEAVRRAAAAADAAMKAANPQPEPAPQPVAQNNNDGIVIAEPPAPTGLPDRVPLTIEPAPPPPPQPEPQPQPTPAPADEADAATWKNRYEAMLGRFRDATSQLTQAQSRMDALENMLATVQSAPRAPSPTPPVSLLTKKDEEDMGPEMIDFVKRAAQEVAGTRIAELEATVQSLTSKLQGTVQHVEQDARAAMHTALAEKLPNWQQINHDEDFHAWLALQDPFSGVMRKKLLTEAYAQNNTARVLSIFQGFVSETAAMRPAAPGGNPAPAPITEQPTRPTLEELAAPGRARTAAAPAAPAEKQIIRTSDINAFWAAVRRGAYKGREELQRQHEEELNLAMREGRILRDT